MPAIGLYTRLERLHGRLEPRTRYQDLCLVFRRLTVRGADITDEAILRAPDGTQLRVRRSAATDDLVCAPLSAGRSSHLTSGTILVGPHGEEGFLQCEEVARFGGRWDHFTRSWHGQAVAPKIYDLQESQVAYARWFFDWHQRFKSGRARDHSVCFLWGDRRGGKTWISLMMTIGFSLDLPRIQGQETVTFIVSKSIPEREEMDRYLRDLIPDSWYIFRELPKHQMFLGNGGVITCVSADDPDSTKRGTADLVLLNEGAKMSRLPFVNALPATRDRGGLVVVPTNPPTYHNPHGFWVQDLHEAHEEAVAAGKSDGMQFIRLMSKDNASTDKQATDRVGAILRIIDPEAAEADDEGRMIKRDDRAFRKHYLPIKHLLSAPPPHQDITAVVTKQRTGRVFEYVMGSDFNAHPAMSGVVFKIYGTPDRPLFFAIADFFEFGDEDGLIDAVERDPDEGDATPRFTPHNLLIVADSSASWQSPIRQQGKTSEAVLRARGYTVVAPQEKKTAQGLAPKNPPIVLTTNRVQVMLDDDRFFVRTAAKRVHACLRDCAAKKYGDKNTTIPTGKHVHIADCLRYVVWWTLPSRRSPGQQSLRTSSLPAPKLR